VDLALEGGEPVTDVDETRGRAILHGGVEFRAVQSNALRGAAGERGLEVERDRFKGEGLGVGAASAEGLDEDTREWRLMDRGSV
jgi:hypothetical protein